MHALFYGFKGLLIGFVVSAPLGPMSVLCIKRVIARGAIQGYATALGAAFGDLFYTGLAAFGLTFLLNFLIKEEFFFKLLGGTFLMILGSYWLMKKRTYEGFKIFLDESGQFGKAFSTAFFLNLANPLTLIVYLAVFSGFGLADEGGHPISAFFLVAGVFIGALTWWFLLIEVVLIFKKKLTSNALFYLNKVTSILVALFGFFILFTALFDFKLLGGTV